jgi:hypothetical protein
MDHYDFTSGVVITFLPGKAPDPAAVIETALRRTANLQYDERVIRYLGDSGVLIGLDGASVAALCETGAGGAGRIALAVGGSSAADPLRGKRQAFCRMLVETLIAGRKPVRQDWFSERRPPDEALLRRMLARGQAPQAAVQVRAEPDIDSLRAVLHAFADPAPGRPALRDRLAPLQQRLAPLHSRLAPQARRLSPLRAGVGVASGVALAASLPIGAGLLAWNATRGPDLRITAAALAVMGLVQGLGVVSLIPMV